jgi:hypothetical protein
VAESADQIRKHLGVLTDFEEAYRRFVFALESERKTGQPYWHPQAFAEYRRDIIEAAPRADLAAKASGLAVRVRMADDTLKSLDLPDQVMDYTEGGGGYGPDGLRVPRVILDTLPRQIGALRVRLEEVEEAEKRSKKSRSRSTKSVPLPAWERSISKDRPWWREHVAALVITIVGTVVGGLLLALIVGGGQ